jgi:FkbM family methyltransferase
LPPAIRPLTVIAVVALVASGALAIAAQRLGVASRFADNERCCHLPLWRNLVVTVDESLGLTEYPAEIGQDKWVLEKVFPGVRDGFFVDVGSGHGTIGSNSVALERRGWKGICVDPFPVHMEGRTCQMFREVVFSKPGLEMAFHTAGGLGGIAVTLGRWNETAARAPIVTLRTVTLDDLLARAGAPPFIHFVSLDIEGAELEALRAFPFERHRVGAWAVEHNGEEPKRGLIVALLAAHGYRRAIAWRQDDFFVPAGAPD